MLTAAVALSVGLTAQFQYHGYAHGSDDRPLATQAPYPTGVAINPAHVPQIGRAWHGPVWRKGVPVDLRPWGVPGPHAYGASASDYARYYARVGNVVVGASPWVQVNDDSSVQRIERARQLWLREQGYTVFPRVFRNPAHAPTAHADARDALIDGTKWHKIVIPIRKRPRFEVRLAPEGEAVARTGDLAGRVVLAHRRERSERAQAR